MWLRFLLLLTISILFVGFTFASVFSLGKVAKIGLYQLLGVEDCYWVPEPVKEEGRNECKPDTNQQKREIAEGLATFLVSAPLAYWMGRKVFVELKNK